MTKEIIIHIREDASNQEIFDLIEVIENHSDIHIYIDDEASGL